MDIDKICGKYMLSSLLLIVALTVVTLCADNMLFHQMVMVPVVVSVAYSVIFEAADVLVWRHIVRNSPGSLTTFFTAVSGFRMLLALATMLIYYLVAREADMTVFIVVFLIYYFVILGHHAIFFVRLTNSGKLNK